MLTKKQTEQLLEGLEQARDRLLENAQSGLQLSMERDTDSGRDSIDQSTSEGMISTALRLCDREQRLLEKIRGAISRVAEGSIDDCEECGEPIGFSRLVARPVTSLCIACKESAEEEEKRHAKDRPTDDWSLG